MPQDMGADGLGVSRRCGVRLAEDPTNQVMADGSADGYGVPQEKMAVSD